MFDLFFFKLRSVLLVSNYKSSIKTDGVDNMPFVISFHELAGSIC